MVQNRWACCYGVCCWNHLPVRITCLIPLQKFWNVPNRKGNMTDSKHPTSHVWNFVILVPKCQSQIGMVKSLGQPGFISDVLRQLMQYFSVDLIAIWYSLLAKQWEVKKKGVRNGYWWRMLTVKSTRKRKKALIMIAYHITDVIFLTISWYFFSSLTNF